MINYFQVYIYFAQYYILSKMPSKLSGIMYNLIKDGYQNFVLSLFINNISILSSIKTKKINNHRHAFQSMAIQCNSYIYLNRKQKPHIWHAFSTCFVYLDWNKNTHISIVIIFWVYQALKIIYPLTLTDVCRAGYFNKFFRKLKQIHKAEASMLVGKNKTKCEFE